MKQLFIDLDGVLADFDSHYESLFGTRPNQDTYDPPDMWDNIRSHGSFYRSLPLMKDAMELFDGCRKFHDNSIILTGIPYSIPNVEQQKKEWVKQYFGSIKVICCRSADKYKYGNPEDILIDDRLKYSKNWIDMGGILILHRDAKSTLVELARHWQ